MLGSTEVFLSTQTAVTACVYSGPIQPRRFIHPASRSGHTASHPRAGSLQVRLHEDRVRSSECTSWIVSVAQLAVLYSTSTWSSGFTICSAITKLLLFQFVS